MAFPPAVIEDGPEPSGPRSIHRTCAHLCPWSLTNDPPNILHRPWVFARGLTVSRMPAWFSSKSLVPLGPRVPATRSTPVHRDHWFDSIILTLPETVRADGENHPTYQSRCPHVSSLTRSPVFIRSSLFLQLLVTRSNTGDDHHPGYLFGPSVDVMKPCLESQSDRPGRTSFLN